MKNTLPQHGNNIRVWVPNFGYRQLVKRSKKRGSVIGVSACKCVVFGVQ